MNAHQMWATVVMFWGLIVYAIVAAINGVDSTFAITILALSFATVGFVWAGCRIVRFKIPGINFSADKSSNKETPVERE
jgi:hypothetical protein